MGKVFNSILLGSAILLVMMFFNGNGLQFSNGDANIFNILLNPTNWKTSGFWTLLTGFSTGAGLLLIGVGAFIRQDWLTRAGMVTSLASITLLPYVTLFTFIVGQTNNLSSCVGSPVCSQLNSIGGMGQIIGAIFIGPLFLYSVWALISWIYSPEPTG
jgi:hypothetical protein